jgi:uncharacterized protein YecE (DUF72 family)
MSHLEEKLGPLILQFPYVAKGKDPEEYRTGADFIRRLKGFVNLLPREFKWGIEIRNSLWVQPPLLDILQSRDISLVFIDYLYDGPAAKAGAAKFSRLHLYTCAFWKIERKWMPL